MFLLGPSLAIVLVLFPAPLSLVFSMTSVKEVHMAIIWKPSARPSTLISKTIFPLFSPLQVGWISHPACNQLENQAIQSLAILTRLVLTIIQLNFVLHHLILPPCLNYTLSSPGNHRYRFVGRILVWHHFLLSVCSTFFCRHMLDMFSCILPVEL